MNVKRFLSDSFRRDIDNRIDKLIVNHKVKETHRGGFLDHAQIQSLDATFGSTARGLKITPTHAAEIYQQKCLDLDLLPNPAAEKRFIEQFLGSIHRKSLRFTGLGLGPRCIRSIVDLCCMNPKIVYIDLSMNRLGDDGAAIMGQYLLHDTPMIYVDLRSNGIGMKGCIDIFKGLKKNCHVTNLDLSAVDGIDRNRIGTQGCKYLAEVIIENQTLSQLNVAMCGITSEGCLFLGPALTKNDALTALDISANRFGSAGALNLFSHQGSFAQLASLMLGRNGIGDEAADVICKQLEVSPTLRTLDLSCNNFGKLFLKKFYRALQTNPNLTSLNLAKNKFGPECADFLHILIRDFPSIRNLNLSGNTLKDAAVSQVAEGLKGSSMLQTLDLSEVEMEDRGAVALAGVIATHPSLQKLYLGTNRITDTGGVQLAQALTHNTNLVVFSMRNNDLKDDTADALLEALVTNTTLNELDVTYNNFSYKSYVKLSQTIDEHKRTISSNVAEVAERHIEWLKEEEQKLFEFRDEIRKQEEIIEATMGERNLKQQELANLKRMKQDETDKIQENLNAVIAEYEGLVEERRAEQQNFNDQKLRMDSKQSVALSNYQTLAAKRQNAQSRLAKAEQKRKEQFDTNSEMIAGLKQQLRDLRDQLQSVIGDNLTAKKLMIEEEERRKEEERQEAAARKSARKAARAKSSARRNAPKASPRPLVADILGGTPAEKPEAPTTSARKRPKTGLARAKRKKST